MSRVRQTKEQKKLKQELYSEVSKKQMANTRLSEHVLWHAKHELMYFTYGKKKGENDDTVRDD